MAFNIYLHRDNFQPEDPLILDKNISSDSGINFTFVDFVPSVVKRSGTVIPQCEVEYHTFSVMIDTANDWLQRNIEWEVVNCETVILLYKYNDSGNYNELRPNDCCFYIYGSEKNNVLKALRLWLRRREFNSRNETCECQVLSYIDFIPENKDDCDFAGARFENVDEVIARINANIKCGAIEGKIITIESLQYDATNDWRIDTEASLSSFSTKNVFILRIFYEKGAPFDEEIGIADFAPTLLSGGGFFKRPKFEPFDEVIDRASRWLKENPLLCFRNAQSIDIKMKSLNAINTRLVAFTEHGDYIRIFRLTYTKPLVQESDDFLPQPVYLSTKLFLPYKKSDTMKDIKQRLSDWVNQYLDCGISSQYTTEADSLSQRCPRLLSAETVEVFSREFRDDNIVELEKAANDDTFHYNRFGNKNAYMFFSLRIFYDSAINDRTRSTTSSAGNANQDDCIEEAHKS